MSVFRILPQCGHLSVVHSVVVVGGGGEGKGVAAAVLLPKVAHPYLVVFGRNNINKAY